MSAPRPRRPRRARGLLGVLAALAAVGVFGGSIPAAHAGGAPTIRGSGSSYVGTAIDQWQTEVQDEVKVNYQTSGSPDGLSAYTQNTIDFAGTEGEFESFNQVEGGQRGYQYVPDVAGGVALLYNIEDKAGNKVDYLHLSRETVAAIFLGKITNWSDERIRQDNVSPKLPNGISLPDQKLTIAYRDRSGTTALFYDFIANIDPAGFAEVRQRNGWPARPGSLVNLNQGPAFSNGSVFQSSDQMAAGIKGPQGKWSIGYDEVSYAIHYDVPYAYIRNAAGKFVRPFALNVSTALEDALLRPDLSQELSQVYASARPEAYPISAYSYLVTQCAAAGDRPTCVRRYPDPAVEQGLASFMRHIACNGQVNMALAGYSPLPPNLSQEVANSVARMQGTQPESLNAGNCANPRFRGSLGVGAMPKCDPLWDCPDSQSGPGGGGGGAGGAGGAGAAGAAGAAGGSAGEGGAADGGTGATADDTAGGKRARSAGGGSAADEWRKANPVRYDHPAMVPATLWPLWALLAIVVLPPLVGGAATWRARGRGAGRP
jgi:phosphate transport system substrate-binding protein